MMADWFLLSLVVFAVVSIAAQVVCYYKPSLFSWAFGVNVLAAIFVVSVAVCIVIEVSNG